MYKFSITQILFYEYAFLYSRYINISEICDSDPGFFYIHVCIFTGSSGLTEAGLSRIQYLPDLRELEISGLNNIINPVIRYTTLRVFTCHHSPCMLNSSIRRLMLFAENLESIELQCCPKVYIQYVINDALDTTKGRRIDQSLKIYFSSGIIRCGKFKEILTLIRVSRCVHVVTDESYVKNVADSSYQ